MYLTGQVQSACQGAGNLSVGLFGIGGQWRSGSAGWPAEFTAGARQRGVDTGGGAVIKPMPMPAGS